MVSVTRFCVPTEIVYGVNSITMLGSEVARLGGKKVFFATDAGVSKSGILERAYQSLKDANIPFFLFDQVPVDPTDKDIDEMASIVKKQGCDCVIGAGGGSVIVACKGTALVANNEGETLQYVGGADKYPNPSLLCIIIQTNAGSGAEISLGTTISDSRNMKKLRIVGYRHAVRLSLLDPTLLMTVPKSQAVGSGVDALTHATEGYLSQKASPLTDCIGLKAIEMIMKNFVTSVFSRNLEAKGQMLMASDMANAVIANASGGLSHDLNGVVTYFYKSRGLEFMSYGLMHCVLFPITLEFNLKVCDYEKVKPLAEAMGVITQNKSLQELREGITESLDKLLADLGAPRKLIWKGIKPEDMVDDGVKIGALSLDPAKQARDRRNYNKEDLVSILRKALPEE